jgi:hypothetical protein
MPIVQTPELVASYFFGIGLVITAIANLVISIRNGQKVDEVHKTTNSGLTDTKNELKETQRRVIELEKMVTTLQGLTRATTGEAGKQG